MTDQELQQLARAYAEEHSYHKDVADDAEEFLRWLTKTHCIVSREQVRKHHKDYAFLARKHPKASERHLSEVIIKEIEDIFGKEMFEERSEK